MSIKEFGVLLVLCIMPLLKCGSSEKKEPVKEVNVKRPNIILIMTDDQGYGDVGYMGHPHLKTPNLDDMASNGLMFNRFYAGSTVCSPTRGSVMTGRHPLRYGICHANCGHIKPEEITIAEMVKERGYTTGHFGKWHLGTLTKTVRDANRGGRLQHEQHYAPPWENGFDECFVTESKVPTWNPMITPPSTAGDVSKSLVEGEYFGTAYWTGPNEKVTENLEGDDSRVIMDRVIPFIDNAVENNQPFLSVIWFHTPHLPVLTGEKYQKQYADLSEDQQHYYGCLTAMDEQVGRLRKHLKQLGVAENTILFFTSDNGPEGENDYEGRTRGVTNGLSGRKRSLKEGGIRVPGIVEWPGTIKANSRTDEPCFTSDYFPTIAEILNIDLSAYNRPYDGVSLLPLFKNEERFSNERFLAFQLRDQCALIQDNFKLYKENENSKFALYDLENDPKEEHDLSTELVAQKEKLLGIWKDWKASQKKSEGGGDY